ncbi:MAG TPA: tetratricopeptide repeat protein [Aggregatilineales bacterium]|nr:tetratricopeptide repeat protein [Aggregatilineales bacterium]
MEHPLAVYMPMDRRQALAHGQPLPERTQGAALFADISGFTPLTEALTRMLGQRGGAEALTRQLNLVYEALIAEIDRFGGSVIGFSGDAITCWFDGSEETPFVRAIACAFAIQEAMRVFNAVKLPNGETVALAVKVAIASGPVRRFLVGDPAIQMLDVLTGETLDRMANAEHMATRGEIVIDAPTAVRLADDLTITEWRQADNGDRFARIEALLKPATPLPWPSLDALSLSPEEIRPWLLPIVFRELTEGLGDFLTELRPTVSLFLRFGGIDYDRDDAAGNKLDSFVRWVQTVVTRYEGGVVDLTVGDKGSYLYAVFGAPVAHEDDAERAVSAALDLRTPPASLGFLPAVQIGISQGTMRTGAFGGSTRRTYGVIGDEANLAARLMQHAQPGEILISGRVQKAIGTLFAIEPLAPVQVKGKSEPITVARVLGKAQVADDEDQYGTSFVGRDGPLAQAKTLLQPIFEGRFAGIISIYGDAGIGKTRLIHALQQDLAREYQEQVLWLRCVSDPILHQSLNPMKSALRRFFGQDSARPEAENRTAFERLLNQVTAQARERNGDLADDLDRRRSFLGGLLNLHWEGSLYELLEPQARFENMLSAIRVFLLALSTSQPVVVYFPAAQYMDADTVHFIALLARHAAGFPLAIMVTSRYRDDGSKPTIYADPEVAQQAIDLGPLTPDAVECIAAETLGSSISPALASYLARETGGNPLFVEQLALDLRERGLLIPDRAGNLGVDVTGVIELPDSINSVLVARIDRLSTQIKAIVQMAAVLGHEFEVRILFQMLKDEDERLATRVNDVEAEVIWSASSDLHYLFRQTLLRDAAYAMQLEQRLRELHRLAAIHIEQVYSAAGSLAPHYADLAFHYGKAEEIEKERHYLRLAGEQAAAHFANAEAVRYFTWALQLAPDNALEEQFALLGEREILFGRQGAREEQARDIAQMGTIAEQCDHDPQRIIVCLRQASYAFATGDYPGSIRAAQTAVALAQKAGLPESEARGQLEWGRALLRQDHYDAARGQFERALAVVPKAEPRTDESRDIECDSLRHLGIVAYESADYPAAHHYLDQALDSARALGDRSDEGSAFNNLGTLAWYEGNFAAARRDFEEALRIRREIGDRRGQDAVLNNLGGLAREQGDFAAARACLEESLRLSREVADRLGESIALDTLGEMARDQGDFTAARSYFERSLALAHALGDTRDEAIALSDLGRVAFDGGDYTTAQAYYEQALRSSRDIGDRRDEGRLLAWSGWCKLQQGDYEAGLRYSQQAWSLAHDEAVLPNEALAATIAGHCQLALGRLAEAREAYEQARRCRQEMDEPGPCTELGVSLAEVMRLQGDLAGARANAAGGLRLLEAGTIDGLLEPFRMFLTGYHVRHADSEPQANALIHAAISLLQRRALQISDEEHRRRFLYNNPIHRELLALGEQLDRSAI